MMTTTTYPVARVAAVDIREGDLYAASPLGDIRESRNRYPRTGYRHQHDEVLRFDYLPETRSLHTELTAWLTHRTTGRLMPSKVYGSSGTPRLERRGKQAEALGVEGPITVRLHETDVLTVDAHDHATLRTGGWPTMLTSRWLEHFLPDSWQIEKHGSDLPWILWTDAEVACMWCESTDRYTTEDCPGDRFGLVMDGRGDHHFRPAHEIVFTEGMIVDLRRGTLVEPGAEVVKSFPKDDPHGASWQSSIYGGPSGR